MRKILFTLMMIAILACPAMAQRYRQHQIAIVDEFGDPVTSITSITIFDSGLGSSPTIYADRAGAMVMTNPITTVPVSANSTFDPNSGFVRWFQRAPDYKVTITDGSKYLTVDSRNELDTRFPWFENYIGAAGTLHVLDAQSLVVGDDSDFSLDWIDASDRMEWVPLVDGSDFNLGQTGTTKNVDFNVFVGTGLGLKIVETTPTFAWDGGAATINHDSNFNVGLGTGTSTGALNFGGAASGAITVDTASTITINSALATAITTDGATSDITIDSTAGRVIIEGQEDAADAILITADGDTASQMRLFNDTGTNASAIELDCDVGGINVHADAGPIVLTADGGTAGDVTIDAEDILNLVSADTAAGAIKIDSAGGLDINLLSSASMDFSAATDATGGFKVQTTVPTGLQLYGGVYSQVTIAGITDGAVGAFRGRVDLDSSSAPVGYVQGARITVEEVGADLSGAVICPLILETYCDAGGNDPSAHYMMRFNTSQGAEMPDAWFMAANPESIAYEANLLHGASNTDKIGAIKIVIGGAIGDAYIYLYSTAGQ